VRACLTAIDHNTNVDRQPAHDVDGEHRYNIVNTRDGQMWTAKAIKEPKNYAWREEIVQEVVQVGVFNSVVDPKIIFPDTDPSLTLISDPDSNPDPESGCL
jgi:hypothetical protein